MIKTEYFEITDDGQIRVINGPYCGTEFVFIDISSVGVDRDPMDDSADNDLFNCTIKVTVAPSKFAAEFSRNDRSRMNDFHTMVVEPILRTIIEYEASQEEKKLDRNA